MFSSNDIPEVNQPETTSAPADDFPDSDTSCDSYYSAKESDKNNRYASNLSNLLQNKYYTDLILIVSQTGEELPCHRCIVGCSSKIFAKIIENSSEIPVRISIGHFDADTVKTALQFFYGKSSAIKGKERDMFKFAQYYEVLEIKKIICKIINLSYKGPQRPFSGIHYWVEENRESIVKPGMSSYDKFKTQLSLWKKLTDKTKWEKMEKADLIRYEKEMELYLEKSRFSRKK